jgi:glycosyltransferase involved in cell wall biosynthesis
VTLIKTAHAPQISVIIPARNAERFIGRSLRPARQFIYFQL